MARPARRALVVVLILSAALFLVPEEKTPPMGRWLVKAGLESKTQQIGRMNVRYIRTGRGPTVILIHGLASSIYSWSDLIGSLSETFDVIALDLPGFGASSQPSDLVFADYAQTVTGLMDALGVEKAHFVGNSMGGAVSLQMAARAPARVDHLVVLDSAGFNMSPSERPFVIQLLASKAAGSLAEGLKIRRLLTGFTLRYLMRDDTRVTSERIDEYLAPILRPGALASARSLLWSRVDEGFVADLSLIRARTLIVWGKYDPWLPESHADRFVAAIQGARKIVLETGHMPQEEQPEVVVRLIGDFLTS